jgi:hypothetical protein
MVRRHKPWVQMTLPVLLAAVLIVLTMPVTCAMAKPMPSGCDTSGSGSMPVGHGTPVKPAPSAPSGVCSHVTAATKALTPENLEVFALFTAIVSVILLVAPAMPRVARVVLEPSPPPGLVLAATTVIRI